MCVMASDLTITHELERRLTGLGLVSRSSAVMGGALVFAGTRVPARTMFDYLLEGSNLDAFLDDFPTVDRRIAQAVLEQVRSTLAA